jgi:signal transduction histidine kinase
MYNESVLTLLKTSPTELRKKTIWDFLAEPDQPRMAKILENEKADFRTRVRLNVIDSSQMPHTLDCMIQPHRGQTFIFIGEEPQRINQTAIEELMKIQNEMTVTMREELKSGKRLSENNRYLDDLVTERTAELVRHQERLRAMLVELTLVEQCERQKLANDLHDYLAQMLIACRLKLSEMTDEGNPAQSSRLIHDVDDILDQSLTFTRTLIAGLNPAVLQHQGLMSALCWLANDLRRLGLNISRPSDIPTITVPEEIGILVYKTVRELLLNVLKHSGVKDVLLQWECPSDHDLIIRVMDSGKGFDPAIKQFEQEPGHLGLFFYRERIKAVNGHLDIISISNEGTTVTIKIPLSPPDDRINNLG